MFRWRPFSIERTEINATQNFVSGSRHYRSRKIEFIY